MTGHRIVPAVLLLIALAGPARSADSTPPPARTITLTGPAVTPEQAARAIREQTGIEIDVAALDSATGVTLDLSKANFWTAVQQLADRTGSRVEVSGGRIALRPGKSLAPVSVSGPFRFTPREVYARIDPQTGKSAYEVTIGVTWEPWLVAYRIDTTPTITTAKNDRGQDIRAAQGGARSLVSGSTAALSVRPAAGRADQSITLIGSVRVTIADEMLAFTFDASNPQPAPAQKGVTAMVTKAGADGTDWFAVIDVRQPKSDVVVESYEYGVFRNNTARLVPPRGNPIAADVLEPADQRFGFKGLAKQVGPGWKLEYRTPGPLREIVVPFELKSIPLP